MKATALICTEKQEFQLRPVTLPDPAADQIAIRTVYSGVSIGTEFALIRNKISWGPFPLCTGYQGTGIVTAVGSAITNFKPNDKVYFRGNDAMTLDDGSKVSCVAGTHCSHAVLKPNTSHGADHVTHGAGMDVASMFVLPAVGLYGVDMAGPGFGQTVVVHGIGLIGLGVVAACVGRGCVVIAVDINPEQLNKAKAFGADYVINSGEQDLTAEVMKISPGGADVVFEVTGLPKCIDRSVALARRDGSFVWQGNYGTAPVVFDFQAAHARRLKMYFPCDDGLQPCRRAVIKQMGLGVLKWEHAITHRVDFRESASLFSSINQGSKEITGAVIRWSHE